MVLKLVFFDKTKYNQAWLDRLLDRVGRIKDRAWIVEGGAALGSPEIEFKFKMKDGSEITSQHKLIAQKVYNQIVMAFVLEQINVERFIADGNDMTQQLMHR